MNTYLFPVEKYPTVRRLVVHLGILTEIIESDWSKFSSCCSEIHKSFGAVPPLKIKQNLRWGKSKNNKFVDIFPSSFIPEMKKIINKYYTVNNSQEPPRPKRKRIQKDKLN